MPTNPYDLGPVTSGLPSGFGGYNPYPLPGGVTDGLGNLGNSNSNSTLAAYLAGIQQPQRPQYTGVNGFLASPTGQLALTGLGAGLSAYSNSKSQEAGRQSQQAISQAQLDQQYKQMLAQLSESLTQNAYGRAQSTLNAQPLGAEQQYAARTGAQNAALNLLSQGPALTPGNPAVAARMGHMATISPDAIARMQAALSPEATQNALAQRQKDLLSVNPSMATTDLSTYFGGQPSPLSQALGQSVNDYRTQAQGQLNDSESYARRMLQAAIDGGQFGPASVGGRSTASPFPGAAQSAPNASPSSPVAPGAASTSPDGTLSVSNGQLPGVGNLPIGGNSGGTGNSIASGPTSAGVPNMGAPVPTSGAIARAKPDPVAAAHGNPDWGTSYWQQMTNPQALASVATNETHKAHDYYGGSQAPRIDQLTPQMQQALQKNYGVELGQDDISSLVKRGWQYGDPAPNGFEYDRHSGLLTKQGSVWGKIANVAAIAAPIAATVLTGGAASPWLVASIGAGTGALASAANGGGWKGALTGAAFGAASGALPGSTGNIGAMTGKQIATNVAERAALGAGQGAITGGTQGALRGAAYGGASAGLAGLAGQLAPTTAPLANRIAAQAGTQAAFGALTGGERGALLGAGAGALGAGFNNLAVDPTDKRAQYLALLAQRAPQLYGAVS